jgi:hypothetical protein
LTDLADEKVSFFDAAILIFSPLAEAHPSHHRRRNRRAEAASSEINVNDSPLRSIGADSGRSEALSDHKRTQTYALRTYRDGDRFEHQEVRAS